jgi:cyclin B
MYMHTQPDIDASMRAVVVDELVQSHLQFRLTAATLYLSISLLDQYCTATHVQPNNLHLVGVTALLIAGKFEEVYPPKVRDYVDVLNEFHTWDDILEMEMKLILFFDYNVSCPTSFHFLTRFLRIGGFSLTSMTAHRASYFSERCLQEHEMLSYRPSLLAAAAVYLAGIMAGCTWVRCRNSLFMSLCLSHTRSIDLISDPRTSGIQRVHGGASPSMRAPHVPARE